MKNIVLIGMPGCGKSTVAKILSERLNRSWFDVDQEIINNEKISIDEMYEKYGEDYFRSRETACIKRFTEQSGIIVATGGGSIIRNAELIRKNAVVVYLERSPESILTTLCIENRFLLRDGQGGSKKIYELYKQRRPLYEKAYDIKVSCECPVGETVNQLLIKLSEYGII